METIIAYLNTMFSALPRTEQVERLKQELLSGMEEKYVELKREGKTENEAIGIVISEFGNIEELTAELGIHPVSEEEQLVELSEEMVIEYTTVRRTSGFWIGLGVFLSICSVSFLLVLDTLFEQLSIQPINGSMEMGTLLGLIGMFIMLAIAVGIFIYYGMKLERYKFLEKGFQLPYASKMEIQRKDNLYSPTYRASIIIGVSLCVLSPAFIFTASLINDDYAPFGVAAFLISVALAVFLFIYYGNIKGAYTTLLNQSLVHSFNNKEKKEEERVISLLGSIIWPLATVIFLFTGFVYHRWDINWVIFPITGILFGMIGNVYRLIKGKHVA